jgi:hypothetical protein
MATKSKLVRITPEAKRALALLMASQGKSQETAASDAIMEAWRKEAEKIAREELREE